MRGYLADLKKSKQLYWLCFIAYTASYIGRYNYSAVISELVSLEFFTKSQAGFVSTVYFFCYGAGQLINGFLGDRLSPVKMVFSGMFISAIANLLLPSLKSHIVVSVVWGINGLAQSMLWSPILFIISNVLAEEYKKTACFYVAVTTPIGTILAYLLVMLSIKFFKWQYAFWSVSVLFLLICSAWLVVTNKIKKYIIVKDEDKQEDKSLAREKKHKSKVFSLLATSGVLISILPTMFHGMLRDGIMTWVPTMITESYSVSSSFSLFLTLFLPVINITGVYACTFLYEKVFKNEIKTTAAFFALTVIPVSILVFIGKIGVITVIALLAVATTLLTAVNHIMMAMVPLRFSSFERSATVSGILNSVTYMGSSISGYGFGVLSENIMWQGTIILWLVIIALSFVLSLIAVRKWSSFIER